jgi:hypothetical protein
MCGFFFALFVRSHFNSTTWLQLAGPGLGKLGIGRSHARHASSNATRAVEVPEPALGTKLPNSAGAAELPN